MRNEDYRPDQRGPLHNVRVLDLSHLVAGNILTQVLADLGADVIKIEPPSGDTLRAWTEAGIAVQWKLYARNKRSIVLDLKQPGGSAVFEALLGGAQMLVENFRPGTLERLGWAPERLLAVQPGLVVVRLSGWGQTGPYRDRPGFGTLIEALSGFAHKNGFPDHPPALPNLGLADSVAGLYGASAALVALREAEVGGGQGQVVDVSLLEPFLSILGGDAAVHRASGRVPERTGNRTQLSAPRGLYPCKDGRYLALSCSTQAMTQALFRAIGRPGLAEDPRFLTNPDRIRHVDALDAIIQEFIGARSFAENMATLSGAGVTVGPVLDGLQTAEDPHVVARGALVALPDAELGRLPAHGVVPRLSRTPGVLRRPAPELDEHAAEILRELGLGVDARSERLER